MDFESYWQGVRDEVLGADRDWERIVRDQTVSANGGVWRIDWVRLSSIRDTLIWGWLAVPIDRTPNGACMVWLPGYSYGTPPPDPTCLVAGVATLCVNVHGRMPDEPYVNPAGKNDYILQDIDDPSSYILKLAVGHSMRALSVACDVPGVHHERIAVGGMSQGGALAIMAAANSPIPRLCLADMPFLSHVRSAVKQSSSPVYKAIRHRLATDHASADQVVATLELFDPVHHAPHVNVPTWLSAGGKDPSVKAEGVEKVYHALGTQTKHYEYFANAGHVFLPEMNRAHSDWIGEHILH